MDIDPKARVEDEECVDFVIEKGNLDELRNNNTTLKPIPFEYTCYLYDQVEDFFVAKNDQGIQQISWIYLGKHHNRLLAMQQDEAEIKHCFTMPAYRGRGLYRKVILAIVDHLRGRGIRRAFMCVHQDNIPSIKAIERSGFSLVAQKNIFKLFGKCLSARVATVDIP